MIISRIERIATVVVAVLMWCAACAYLITISDVLSEHLTFSDLCWIYSPAVFLFVYGAVLMLCYKQRGIRWDRYHRVDTNGYQGSKYPWL